jgi:hypothetical protein
VANIQNALHPDACHSFRVRLSNSNNSKTAVAGGPNRLLKNSFAIDPAYKPL